LGYTLRLGIGRVDFFAFKLIFFIIIIREDVHGTIIISKPHVHQKVYIVITTSLFQQTLLKVETDIVLFEDCSCFNVYNLLRERKLDRNNYIRGKKNINVYIVMPRNIYKRRL